MHTNMWLKRIFALVLVTFTMLFFSGCCDLGDFQDIQAYYDSFGDVRLMNQDGDENAKDYSVKDYFYNSKSINDFAGDIVSKDKYIYFILPVQKGFNLAEFSMYLQSEENGTLYFSLFISDSIPENIRKYDDPKFKEKKDDDDKVIYDSEGNPVMEEIEYGDLLEEDSIYQGSIFLSSQKWNSFTAKLITKQSTEINKYHVKSGEYIIVRFENNSGLGKDKEYSSLSFSMTNLLIRAL